LLLPKGKSKGCNVQIFACNISASKKKRKNTLHEYRKRFFVNRCISSEHGCDFRKPLKRMEIKDRMLEYILDLPFFFFFFLVERLHEPSLLAHTIAREKKTK
jgi:hypothetical protein